MKTRVLALAAAFVMIFALAACSSNTGDRGIDQDQVQKQINGAGLSGVKVRINNDLETVKLEGHVQTEKQRTEANRIATAAASAYSISNQIEVRPENSQNQSGNSASHSQ